MSYCLHIYGTDVEEINSKLDNIKNLLSQGFISGELWDLEDGIDLEED